MALTFTSAGLETVVPEPFTVTRQLVTITSDGSATGDGSLAHGGPSGQSPFKVEFVPTVDSSTGSEVVSFLWTGTDVPNDEVDFTVNTADAIPNTQTVQGYLYCWFLPGAPDVGRSAPVGYTAPSNANF